MREESFDCSVRKNERIGSKGNQDDKNGVWPETEDEIFFICSYQEKSDFLRVANGSPLFQFQEKFSNLLECVCQSEIAEILLLQCYCFPHSPLVFWDLDLSSRDTSHA